MSHTLQPPRPSGGGSVTASQGAAAGGNPEAAATALVSALEAVGAERTRHGWLLLPDATSPPCGPIFLAVLHKAASSDLRRVKVNKYARQSRLGGSSGGGSSDVGGSDGGSDGGSSPGQA